MEGKVKMREMESSVKVESPFKWKCDSEGSESVSPSFLVKLPKFSQAFQTTTDLISWNNLPARIIEVLRWASLVNLERGERSGEEGQPEMSK